MDPTVITSLTVSLIAILVIFTVLVVLIYTIKLLVRLIPYKEPPAVARARTSPSATVTPDIISAISVAMATHLRKSPQEFYITQINPK
jgi:Na+-transporting methylmalonyl-CoA/oxaloacetate decarboxylase gamma subunit